MNNRQLKLNIEQLDLRIAKLGTEIEEMGTNNGYESKMGTLTDLMNLRDQLKKNYGDKPSNVIKELDRQIDELVVELKNYARDDVYQTKLKNLDALTKVRCQLAESGFKGSNAPALISGLLGVASILLVLHYEKTDIVTSKALSIATSLFRGK
jgi:hypothetical protein